VATTDRTYTYDLATDRGKVRLGLTDTNAPGTFSDVEVDHFLSTGGTVDAGVVEGLKVLLVDSARRTRLYTRDGMSYNDTAQVAGIKAAIDQYGGASAWPSIVITMPAPLPMDEAFDITDP